MHVAAAVCSTQAGARARLCTACGRQQTGFLPVPACLLARRPAQHTGLLGLWVLTARNAGGFGSRKAIGLLEMWPGTESAT